MTIFRWLSALSWNEVTQHQRTRCDGVEPSSPDPWSRSYARLLILLVVIIMILIILVIMTMLPDGMSLLLR